jgi:quinoprotein glucose dehydrogenase
MTIATVSACGGEELPRTGGPAVGWPVVGGGPGGPRYSPLDEITPQNAHQLEVAWEFHTGDLRDAAMQDRNHAFQATPILLDRTLYFCTPRSRVVALDAETGAPRWTRDPAVDLSLGHYNFNCRGVAAWTDPKSDSESPCTRRIFVATADARLVALDAATGRACAGFGDAGVVPFGLGLGAHEPSEVGISSPPTVIGDVVVVGSAISESRRIDMPSGAVQAFDARSGEPRWRWDPIPRDANDAARATWKGDSADRVGAANVWSLASADPARDLVFLPSSSPSPDFYGGERIGDNRYADSVSALRASTGELVWSFQTVHHDLWDYDVASQPVLIDFPVPGGSVPAVVQATKTGNVFILDRETGEPLIPVEERAVPQTTVPGEVTSPTQPFPTWPPALVPQLLRPEDAWGLTPWDRNACRKIIGGLRSEGVFTPPSLEGSVLFPGSAGGSNWGSVAYDPERRLLVANTSRIANTVQLIPREAAEFERDRERYVARFEQSGAPYVARFGVLLSPLGIPCNAPPWGALAVLDLEKREQRWEVPLGTVRDLSPIPIPLAWGVPNMGGPIATGGGVVFIGAALDDYLRAFDIESGAELWHGRLPAGGQATPMTYRLERDGRQFVVIAAGGHSQMRSTPGDSLIAFALPRRERSDDPVLQSRRTYEGGTSE